jgi:hypothetical protein
VPRPSRRAAYFRRSIQPATKAATPLSPRRTPLNQERRPEASSSRACETRQLARAVLKPLGSRVCLAHFPFAPSPERDSAQKDCRRGSPSKRALPSCVFFKHTALEDSLAPRGWPPSITHFRTTFPGPSIHRQQLSTTTRRLVMQAPFRRPVLSVAEPQRKVSRVALSTPLTRR